MAARRALVPALMLVAAGCHGSSKPASAPTTAATSSTTTASTGGTPGSGATPTVPIQTSGTRTVLSPIGLNVRAQPSKTAAVLGSADQGSTLTVLSHTDAGGGWYQVKGETVTSGYITDDPTLSAAGMFTAYSADQGAFSALYPAGWSATAASPTVVVFHPPTGQDSIVITTGATISQLGDAQLGYHADTSTTAVVCGFTGQLVTYAQVSGSPPTTSVAPTSVTPTTPTATGVVAERYLVQINLTLDPQHVVGLNANLADLSQLPAVDDVVNSLSFPFPQCQGGSAAPGPSTVPTVPPTTVF